MKVTFIAACILILSEGLVSAQEAKTVKVIVRNLKSAEGTLKVALYDSKETYMNKSFRGAETSIEISNQVEVVFENLPEGQYTLSLYHDANGNGFLDKNFLGIPTEDYAFSNNADGRFGPPSYEECVFEVKESMTVQTIDIN